MPIKPENAARYPADWPEVRARILARAGNCCEGSPAFPDCRVPNYSLRTNEAEGTLTRIVLTVGHLDHVPENCQDENLRAWCQRCHLTYDAKHHAKNARATRRARKAMADLLDRAP
jgi:hypothetical protein